jgi:hypothetical protein
MTVRGRSGGDAVLVAALAAGVSERTVRRRLDEPVFKRQVDDARAEMLAQATARLTGAALEAVEALRALLGSDLNFARLGAARAILEVGAKYREQLDLAERVAALEERLTAPSASRGGSLWDTSA